MVLTMARSKGRIPYPKSRWELLAERLESLRLERMRIDSDCDRVVREMAEIEADYRDRHPEITDDEFEKLLKRSAS